MASESDVFPFHPIPSGGERAGALAAISSQCFVIFDFKSASDRFTNLIRISDVRGRIILRAWVTR